MPTGYYGSYLTLAIFAGAVFVLVGGTLLLNRLIAPRVRTEEKYMTYECGVDPIGGGWTQSTVRYYIFALLFVIFDVEAVFLFPWATVFEKIGIFAFVEMMIFIGILALGLVYAWRKKVLEWV
ncbi:MAG TPA: NADH-quinone oxidoreductase subunit A [Actinomycetota bacterium]|nr:NADH-quinone oxidoreductase subunit A [Actinomycetota bacterium]